MYLKPAQQSNNMLLILKHDLFNFFCTVLANVFVATKDKFETLHLPDLINDVPISFTVLLISLIRTKNIYFNLQHYIIIATPSGGLIKS